MEEKSEVKQTESLITQFTVMNALEINAVCLWASSGQKKYLNSSLSQGYELSQDSRIWPQVNCLLKTLSPAVPPSDKQKISDLGFSGKQLSGVAI